LTSPGSKERWRYTGKTAEELGLNILIVDERMAGITLPDRGSDDFLTPTFFSEDEKFVALVRGIFEWYW
jgi:hypothetical protein